MNGDFFKQYSQAAQSAMGQIEVAQNQQSAANNAFGSGNWMPTTGYWGNAATIVRYDPTTDSNVPVTQAWVDEVCAKLVELRSYNTGLQEELAAVKYANQLCTDSQLLTSSPAVTVEDVKPDVDRMWAAVVAVS